VALGEASALHTHMSGPEGETRQLISGSISCKEWQVERNAVNSSTRLSKKKNYQKIH